MLNYKIDSLWTKFYLWYWDINHADLPEDFCTYAKKMIFAILFLPVTLFLRFAFVFGVFKIRGKRIVGFALDGKSIDASKNVRGLLTWIVMCFFLSMIYLAVEFCLGHSIKIHNNIIVLREFILLIGYMGYVLTGIILFVIGLIVGGASFENSQTKTNLQEIYSSFKNKYCAKINWIKD